MEWDEVGIEGKAELIPLDPLVDEKGVKYIPLMYLFPYGRDVLRVDQNSVLVRPFYNVLKEGKPMGTISYVFYQDKENYFILGCFVYTKRRILFFPGVTNTQLVTTSENGDVTNKDEIVDHYSLEESLRTYHLTLKNKRESRIKYPKMNTIRVKEDMFLWLCFGIKSANMLETAPKTQEIRLKAHNSIDLKRRVKLIEDSRGSIFNVVKVKQEPESDFYINFEIFVSTKQSRDDLPPNVIYNVGMSHCNTVDKEDRKDIPTRLHYVLLKGFSGSLWVRVSKLKGTLHNHLVFVSKSN
jgi:hypothetical protein